MDENAPKTEAEAMAMVGFDPAKTDEYTEFEFNVMAKKAQKLCKKYKLGEYARHTGDTPPDSGDEG